MSDTENNFRILFLGDIVGEPGRKAVINGLPRIKEQNAVDFVIANGENAAGGRGITPKICIDLLRAGVAVVTTGDHVWDQAEIVPYFETEPRLLRPINYPDRTAGQGSVVLEGEKAKVGVICVQCRTFMRQDLENPFIAMREEVRRVREEEGARIIFVDVHGETTSEKIAMGRAFDGKVSAVVGTHTHVQTADERVFPGGTAFLCDAGMCGPVESILGRKIESILHRFWTSTPSTLPVAKGDVKLCGAIVDVDATTGRARAIERFTELCQPDGNPVAGV